jgi:pyrimidine oxygenase
MSGTMDLGVFMPIANNGWIMSEGAPQYAPTFELNADIARLAEGLGFDFLLSQSKWRGFGGSTAFWDDTLESFTLMSALAAVTERVGLIASVQPLLFPPAVVAKIAATLEDISGGRSGINVVAGSYLPEYEQMGVVTPGYAEHRYDYATEWLEVVKRLWTEKSVTHSGANFQLEDCRSDPKPVQKPHPAIISAGSSEAGVRFATEHCTHAFLAAPREQLGAINARYHESARQAGRAVKTYSVFTVVLGDTDAEAQALVDHWVATADDDAISAVYASYTRQGAGESGRRRVTADPNSVFYGTGVAGSPTTIADHMERLVRDVGLDGILLSFPDWIPDMTRFGAQVMPLLRERGLLHEPVRFASHDPDLPLLRAS